MITLCGHLTAGKVPPCYIHLDGLPKSHVVEAHTEEGWIVRYQQDCEGNLLVVGGELVTERLSGAVTATLMEDWRDRS